MRIQTDVYNTKAIDPNCFDYAIMVAIGRNYHHSVIRFRTYDDYGVLLDDFIYEAVGNGFIRSRYYDWEVNNIIKLRCNLTEKKNLSYGTQLKMLKKANYLVNKGTKYGDASIVGIVGWYFLKAKTVGVDGDARLICSEAIYVVCEDVVVVSGDKPTDYINPKDLEADFFND